MSFSSYFPILVVGILIYLLLFLGGTLGTVGKSEVKEDVKEEVGDVEMSAENEVTPVGQEYIEEIKNEEGLYILETNNY